jgi:hypothetical protein
LPKTEWIEISHLDYFWQNNDGSTVLGLLECGPEFAASKLWGTGCDEAPGYKYPAGVPQNPKTKRFILPTALPAAEVPVRRLFPVQSAEYPTRSFITLYLPSETISCLFLAHVTHKLESSLTFKRRVQSTSRMKFTVLAAAAIALLSSSANSWKLALYEELDFMGKSVSATKAGKTECTQAGNSTITGFKPMKGVRSLNFTLEAKRDKDVKCCVWMHMDNRCEGGTDDKLMGCSDFDIDDLSDWTYKLKSVMVRCGKKGVAAEDPEKVQKEEQAVASVVKCKNESSCSIFWSRRCEGYCGDLGFSHMSGERCGWGLPKRCCCHAEKYVPFEDYNPEDYD